VLERYVLLGTNAGCYINTMILL